MKVAASIQARMSSSRLPGKVLAPIAGMPMLQWQVERLKCSRLLSDVIVATTNNPADDEIERFCLGLGISCFRGSEHDVLDRVASLVAQHEVDVHVECFGDSPLIDPAIVDEFVAYLLLNREEIDFVSNTLRTTYPPGSEVVVYKSDAIMKANVLVGRSDPLREHSNLHIRKRPHLFSVKNLSAPDHLKYPELSFEVDTSEDFEVVSFIIEEMKKTKTGFYSTSQIIELLLNHPEVSGRNRLIERRWKKFQDND